MDAPENKHEENFIKFLFRFNVIIIGLLAFGFSAEAFGWSVSGRPVSAMSINTIFLASLSIYTALRRTYRWNKEDANNKRKGEYIAIFFLLYVALLDTLYRFIPTMKWPEEIYLASIEIVAILIGNEAVKKIDQKKRQKINRNA